MENKKYYAENDQEIYVFNTKFILMIAKSLNEQAKNTLDEYIRYKKTFETYKNRFNRIPDTLPDQQQINSKNISDQ